MGILGRIAEDADFGRRSDFGFDQHADRVERRRDVVVALAAVPRFEEQGEAGSVAIGGHAHPAAIAAR
jgi:hypothetical protein